MFGRSGKHNYFGLRGTQLQVAVGVLAGLDFLLFGYDQGVTGGLLTLKSFRQQFPTIDQYDKTISPALKSARSTYQGITVASYNLGCFCGMPTSYSAISGFADITNRSCCLYLRRQSSWSSSNHFSRYLHHGCRGDPSMRFVPASAIHHWKTRNRIWQRAEYVHRAHLAKRVFAITSQRSTGYD